MSRPERGSITPLVIGMAAILALLVVVVVDVSAVFLRRQGLNGVADAAALAATDGAQIAGAYTDQLGEEIQLDPRSARQLVADYLRRSGATARYPGLSWEVAVRGDQVLVRLRGSVPLPLRPPGTSAQVPVVADSSATLNVVDR